jgi:hypothetical protein
MAVDYYADGTGGSGTCAGQWNNLKNRHLGLKLTINGTTHFGWAGLNVTCMTMYGNHKVTGLLTGYAYETIPNKAIITGKTRGPDDVFTRESLAIEVGQRLQGEHVVGALNQIRQRRGVPKLIFCDNESEFTSQIMDLWAYHNQVQVDFSRTGKPTDNAHVESFNGTLRAECLDVHWFATLTEAK